MARSRLICEQDCGFSAKDTIPRKDPSLAADQIAAVQKQFQTASAKVGAQSNPIFVGNALSDTPLRTGTDLVSPDYRTPFPWHVNPGAQREIRPGTVLSVHYGRNVAYTCYLPVSTCLRPVYTLRL